MNIDIIYQDEHLVALNKPPGLLSVPGLGPEGQHCLINRLLAVEPQAKVVHRLDCHTSGIMLFAIGIDMQRALSRLFHDREIDKQYIALVPDWFEEEEGEIRYPLRCDIDNRPLQIVDYTHGKPALTCWRVLARQTEGVRLLLLPQTGRTHQLRVHCAASGFPILGDSLYSSDHQAWPRMLLHADNLRFRHPHSGELLHLFAPCEF